MPISSQGWKWYCRFPLRERKMRKGALADLTMESRKVWYLSCDTLI
jgi:hypothetical protein